MNKTFANHGAIACKAMLASLAIALAACGGGDSGSAGPMTTTPPPATVPPPASPPTPSTTPAPPPPDLDRSASVAGVDANTDGIRDDVAGFIDNQAWSANEKKGAAQAARAIQRTLLASDDVSAKAAAVSVEAALFCLASQSRVNFGSIAKAVFAATVNTEQRFLAYVAFEERLVNGLHESFETGGCDA